MKPLSRSKDWPLSFLPLVLLIFFYREVIWGGKSFVFVDASRFFFPLWKWGAAVWDSGRLPLWNPDAQFGTPYWADPQMACAYPPVFLSYLFLGPVAAFSAIILLHHLWALAGFWVFARSRGHSRAGALWGCLAFGFSLHLICSSWTPPALMTISWLPWVMTAALGVFQGKRGSFLGLSFAWAMQLASGYPVLVYLTGLALLMVWTWERVRGKGEARASWKGLFLIAGAGLISAAYNLAWGIPFAEFLSRSNYGKGAGKFHDLGWADLGTALDPFLQGHPLLPSYHGPHYWVSTYYLGLPVLVLGSWGWRRRAGGAGASSLLPLFLFLSLGVLGAGKVLRTFLPGYDLVVHSGFWISLVCFWTAWWSMEAYGLFMEREVSGGGRWSFLSLVLVVYGLSWALGRPLFPWTFALSMALLAAGVWARGVRTRGILLLSSLVLSLGPPALSMNILLDDPYYTEPPKVLAELPGEGRLFFTPPLMAEAGILKGPDMPGAYRSAKERLYPNWPLAFGREQAPLYDTIQLASSFAWTFQAFRYSEAHSRRVLDYLGVRYLFGKNHFTDMRVLPAGPEGVEVSENGTALAKWFSVVKALPAAPGLEEDLARAAQAGLDYSKTCFAEGEGLAGDYAPRKVRSRHPSSNEVEVESSGDGKALVVSSETAYPGWKVAGDPGGKEGPGTLVLVNHAFRGLLLAPGEDRVLLRFTPTSFRLGLFISLSVLGLWTGMAARLWSGRGEK